MSETKFTRLTKQQLNMMTKEEILNYYEKFEIYIKNLDERQQKRKEIRNQRKEERRQRRINRNIQNQN